MTHYQIRGGEEGRKKSSNFNNTTIIIRESQVDSLSTLILMAQYSWNSHSVPWNTIAAFSPTSSRDRSSAHPVHAWAGDRQQWLRCALVGTHATCRGSAGTRLTDSVLLLKALVKHSLIVCHDSAGFGCHYPLSRVTKLSCKDEARS